MIDLIKLLLEAGDGGHGRVSFRREKYVPKGGPDGGDGGHGGSIVLRGSNHYTTLSHFAGKQGFTAESGQAGGKKKKSGHHGEDLILDVPVGTLVWVWAQNDVADTRRKNRFTKIPSQKYYLEAEGQHIPARPAQELKTVGQDQDATDVLDIKDSNFRLADFRKLEKKKLFEITEPGQEVVVARGGDGGRGSARFASSSNTTPLEAEYGTEGDKLVVFLELKLLADVGLIGFPNAGKSTLLSVLTKARPKIGNYPFTTLNPQLGKLEIVDSRSTREVVVADIPGLIEGASTGKGLGFSFLRHIENCKILLYMLFVPEDALAGHHDNASELATIVWDQYTALNQELVDYQDELKQKPKIVAVNKVDLMSPEVKEAIEDVFKKHNQEILFISAATRQNLDVLSQKIANVLD